MPARSTVPASSEKDGGKDAEGEWSPNRDDALASDEGRGEIRRLRFNRQTKNVPARDHNLFAWQQYENTHVRVDGGDELLVEKRFCLGEMEDEAENEDGESDGEERGNSSRFSVLNKTLTYCASYWDAASEELISSHAHEIGSDSATSGRSSRGRRRVRTQPVSPWPSTSVAPYVAVVGEKIFLRLFDCNNEKEADFIATRK